MLASHWSIEELHLKVISATLCLLITGCSQSTDNAKMVTEPKNNEINPATATLGGGCFWCIEAVFEQIKGVKSVVSGYAGGNTENPTYDEVCQGTTGHAEICQIHYDPNTISYDELLEVFWLCHDPTTLNRQGNDVGTQYRSIIFYENASQKKAAETAIAQAAARFADKIVTEVVPLKKVYIAEEYHQDYFAKHPNDPYCAVTIPPKLLKVKNLDVYAPNP